MNCGINEIPENKRAKQIDRVINGLMVIMHSNPDYDLIDIIHQISLKLDQPNIYLLKDDMIEEAIDDIFGDMDEEDILYGDSEVETILSEEELDA